jgi:hypothetical protein
MISHPVFAVSTGGSNGGPVDGWTDTNTGPINAEMNVFVVCVTQS